MKNKATTYVLGAAVAVVWGLIIFRIVAALNRSDDDDAPAKTVQLGKDAYNDFAIRPDTTSLLLNYRDPFGLVKEKDTIAGITRKQTKRIAPINAKPAMNWDFIQYSGYVLNPGTKKVITLVNINGRNATLSDGATFENVKLIRNLRDSIRISYNGITKCIIRKNAL